MNTLANLPYQQEHIVQTVRELWCIFKVEKKLTLGAWRRAEDDMQRLFGGISCFSSWRHIKRRHPRWAQVEMVFLREYQLGVRLCVPTPREQINGRPAQRPWWCQSKRRTLWASYYVNGLYEMLVLAIIVWGSHIMFLLSLLFVCNASTLNR